MRARCKASGQGAPLLQPSCFRGPPPVLRRREIPPRAPARRLRAAHALPPGPPTGGGMWAPFPFGVRGPTRGGAALPTLFKPHLRTDSPVAHCASHGTLPPPQSSWFAQESLLLPPRSALARVPGGLSARPFGTRATSAYLGGDSRPPPSRVEARPLQRHPFSGLIHSAGKLLHTSWRISTSRTTVLLSL